MSKLIACLAASAAALASPCGAAILGPNAADCAAAARRPAMLVKVTGLKSRGGIVRVQAYDDPDRYFDKGAYIERVDVRPPAAGAVDICLPVPRAGIYAVSVRHDVSGDGKADLTDGGGMSGNPNLSLMDVVFKRRPSPVQVQVQVQGLTIVPVVMNYVRGTNVGPASSAER